MARLFGLIVFIVALMEAVGGLKLSQLSGPRYPDRGSSARLACDFDTEDARLYSVKWYKDENEFFRYMPDNRPQSQVFPLAGVTLDEANSGIDHVLLTGLSLSSSGSYRCEVSTEAPNFETIFENHNMTVYSYPQFDPRLDGVLDTYNVYDMVVANCTAAPSNPAPTLHWYINNLKADDYLVEHSPHLRLPDETFSAWATLKFSAQRQHFLEGGVLTLRCEAEAPPLPTAATSARAHLAGALYNQKLAQENFHKSVACKFLPSLTPLVLLPIFFNT